MPAAFPRCIVVITVDRTEVRLSPRDTDSSCAARLCIHGHCGAKALVLPLHVTGTGFFNACIIVSTGVNLAVAVCEGAVPDDLTFPYSPGFAVWV